MMLEYGLWIFSCQILAFQQILVYLYTFIHFKRVFYTERCYDYEDFSPTRGYQNEDCYEDGYGDDQFDQDAYDDDYEDFDFNYN